MYSLQRTFMKSKRQATQRKYLQNIYPTMDLNLKKLSQPNKTTQVLKVVKIFRQVAKNDIWVTQKST